VNSNTGRFYSLADERPTRSCYVRDAMSGVPAAAMTAVPADTMIEVTAGAGIAAAALVGASIAVVKSSPGHILDRAEVFRLEVLCC
jgi:hypothetical protein